MEAQAKKRMPQKKITLGISHLYSLSLHHTIIPILHHFLSYLSLEKKITQGLIFSILKLFFVVLLAVNLDSAQK